MVLSVDLLLCVFVTLYFSLNRLYFHLAYAFCPPDFQVFLSLSSFTKTCEKVEVCLFFCFAFAFFCYTSLICVNYVNTWLLRQRYHFPQNHLNISDDNFHKSHLNILVRIKQNICITVSQ